MEKYIFPKLSDSAKFKKRWIGVFMMKINSFKLFLFIGLIAVNCASAIDYPGEPQPGTSTAQINGNQITRQNQVIAFSFEVNSGQIQNAQVNDKTRIGETPVQLNEPFILKIGATEVRDSDLNISGSAQTAQVTGNPNARKLGNRFDSRQASVTYLASDSSYKVIWKAILRDGSNYVLLETTVEALTADVDLTRLTLFNGTAASKVPTAD